MSAPVKVGALLLRAERVVAAQMDRLRIELRNLPVEVAFGEEPRRLVPRDVLSAFLNGSTFIGNRKNRRPSRGAP